MNSMVEEMIVYKTDLSNRKLDVLWCTNCWTRETYVTPSNGGRESDATETARLDLYFNIHFREVEVSIVKI